MKIRWLRPFIVLVAALIVLISNFMLKRPIMASLIWLLLTIIVFYIISTIVVRIIDRTVRSENKENEPELIEDEAEKDKTETQQEEQ